MATLPDRWPPGAWLGFSGITPKDTVQARGATFFQCSIKELEWQWKPGAWLIRPREEEDDGEGAQQG